MLAWCGSKAPLLGRGLPLLVTLGLAGAGGRRAFPGNGAVSVGPTRFLDVHGVQAGGPEAAGQAVPEPKPLFPVPRCTGVGFKAHGRKGQYGAPRTL